jgi:hypothetical protein
MDILIPASSDEISGLLSSIQEKACRLDPIPSWIIKRNRDILSPFIASICNVSFQQEYFPPHMKEMIIRTLLIKCGLDPTAQKNYRLVSNLSFISKVLEQTVHNQLMSYMAGEGMMPPTQSANRKQETALFNKGECVA